MSDEGDPTWRPSIPRWISPVGLTLASTAIVVFSQQFALLDTVRIDRLVERGFLALSSDVIRRYSDDGVRLIFIDPHDNGVSLGSFVDNPQRWRMFHAELLRRLAEKGARVVAFDLVFPTTTEGNESASDAFVSAIQDVTNNTRTRVIVGYDAEEDPDRRLYEAIPRESSAQTRVGASVRLSRDADVLQRLLLASADVKLDQRTEKQTMHTPISFPLAVHIARNTPDLQRASTFIYAGDDVLLIEGTETDFDPIQVDVEECRALQTGCVVPQGYNLRRDALLPVWMGASRFVDRPYHRVFEQIELSDDYRDKVVIIGARTEPERVSVDGEPGDRSIWGYEVHARILADLQSGTYLRRPGLITVFIWAAVLVVAGASARRFLPKLEVPVALGPLGSYSLPIGLLIVVAIDGLIAREALRAHELHPLAYHWLAVVAGYYLVGRPQSGSPVQEGS